MNIMGGEMGQLICKNVPIAVENGYWMEWFLGLDKASVKMDVSAEKFLPELLSRARALKEAMKYTGM